MRTALVLVVAVALSACAARHTRNDARGDAHGHAPRNLLLAGDGVYSGGEPEGDADFNALQRLGVRTVVSVDGAEPDLERAHARGVRYVHIPTVYSGIETAERLKLAKALRDLPRPIYVHCHHGKHRGPAAAAVALVSLGEMTPDEGLDYLERAHTSHSYPGLFACVRDARTLDPSAFAAAGDLPEVAHVEGLPAAMAAIDRVWDRLGLIEAAGWTTPADHPDLVPAQEAGQLHDLFRTVLADNALAGEPDELRAWMGEAATTADALEQALVTGHVSDARARFATLNDRCKTCHNAYRQ